MHAGPGPHDYSWKPLASRTHAEIDERFADGGQYAAGNLMVAIPPGMMAIDRDDDEGGRAALARLTGELGELPPTLSHKTPHGEHLIYRTPPGWSGRAWVGKDPSNPLPAGIDLRVPGQILMAAPSAVPGPDGLLRYGPLAGDHVAALPPAYLRAWTPPQPPPTPPARRVPVPPHGADRAAKYVNNAMNGIADDLASRQPGGRNAAAYAAGLKTGSLLGGARATPGAERAPAAWTDEAAEQALMDAAQRNGYISKDGQEEARRAIRSGLHNGLRNPRVLPDFTTPATQPDRPQPRHTPKPSGPAASQRSQAAASAPARRAGRWQNLVPPDIRREVEAADRAVSARRHAAIAAHQQALERHDRAPTQQTAHEVERTRAEAHAAHQAYTHDGRHITGRHDAAMLRWAEAITAQRGRPAPSRGQPGTARVRANHATVAANEAYRAGDLDRARQLVDQAAELDPSRADLWQAHRDQIAARRLVLSARAAGAEGDQQRAGKLLQDARQLDPRLLTLWDGDLPAARAVQRARPTPGHNPAAAPGPRGGASTTRSAGTTQATGGASRPPWPSPRRGPGASGPASQTPDKPQPVPPRSATTVTPRAPRPRRHAAADDPDPGGKTPAAGLSRWPAPKPQSCPQAASPQAGREAATGRAPGPPQRDTSAQTATSGPRKPDIGTASAADWRDQILTSAREPWQPRSIQQYNPSVLRSPDTTGPGAGIEPERP